LLRDCPAPDDAISCHGAMHAPGRGNRRAPPGASGALEAAPATVAVIDEMGRAVLWKLGFF
jgi:hypothetical protein